MSAPNQTVGMTRQQKEAWEKFRVKGRLNYFIFEGILRRGILSAVLVIAFIWSLGLALHAYSLPVWALVLTLIVLSVVFGIGWGALLWSLMDREYLKPERPDTDSPKAQ